MLIERFHEVDAWLDGIDVHEQLLAVEMLQQSVVEAACRRLVVAAPVIDKDATGHNILGVCSMALHVAREISMEASACSSVRTATRTTLPAYLRLFGGREEKAHCEQMVAPIFSEIMLRAYERTRLSNSSWGRHAGRVTFYIRVLSRFVTSTTAPTAASHLIFSNRCNYTTKRCQR